MRYLLIIFCICCLLPQTYAQRSFFNSDEFWAMFRLEHDPPPALSAKDTAIVVASSRVVNRDDARRFIGEVCDGDSLHYYFVYAAKGNWHVLPAKNLSEAVGYMPAPNRDWALYADGYGKIFTSGIDRGMRMAAQHEVNVLYLDYPSYNSSKKLLGNYRFAFTNARNAYKNFVPVFDSVQQLRRQHKMGNGHLSLFFHSMGNNIIRETVRKGRLPELNHDLWVDNLVLNAPCVPQKKHTKWLNQVHFARRIYIHYNPHDRVLKGAHLVSFNKQLGEKIKKPVSTQAVYINFHTLTDDNHSNFLILMQHPVPPKASLNYYHTVLHGDAVNISDTCIFRPSVYHGIGVDILSAAGKR